MHEPTPRLPQLEKAGARLLQPAGDAIRGAAASSARRPPSCVVQHPSSATPLPLNDGALQAISSQEDFSLPAACEVWLCSGVLGPVDRSVVRTRIAPWMQGRSAASQAPAGHARRRPDIPNRRRPDIPRLRTWQQNLTATTPESNQAVRELQLLSC